MDCNTAFFMSVHLGAITGENAFIAVGLVEDTHAAVYKQLGDWVRGCYGKPLATASGTGVVDANGSTVFSVVVRARSVFDRFQMIEDTWHGQRVHAWTISNSSLSMSTARRESTFRVDASHCCCCSSLV